MSALPSFSTAALAAQLAALDAQLAPTPLRVLPMFTAPDPPEDPTGPKADRDRREAAQAQARRDDAALRKPDREP